MAKKNARDRFNLPLRIVRTDVCANDAQKLRHHTAIEISCVVSGEAKLVTPLGEYHIAEGGVFIASPGDTHCIFAPEGEAKLLSLYFEPYYIWSLPSGFSDTALLDTFWGKNRLSTSLVPDKLCQFVSGELQAVEKESKQKKTDYESAIKVHVVSVLLALLRSDTRNRVYKPSESREYNLAGLKKVMDYIDSNIEKDLELDMLASLAGMSKSYFCTVFKRYNGLKPWDYITIKRIDKALRLLSLSAEKKASIALDCGFNNSANFYRAFKKITGRTPGDYENLY